MKVAIQGIKGSYHHQVADRYYVDQPHELLELETFGKVAKAIHKKECHSGLMAIENTIAGTILPNYALISKYNLKVVGEAYLSIQHQLMAVPGTKFEDIEEIRSHPMALLQCDKFLEKNSHIKVIESKDTASTAKTISDNNLVNIAAIASIKSAEIYGLEVIKENIQTFGDNFTRFFVLQKNATEMGEFNKASIKFSVPHEKGALVKILNFIPEFDINMEKIQSVPIIDKPWEYAFHMDLSFDHPEQFETMLDKISAFTNEIEILGKYVNAWKKQENQWKKP